MAIKKISLSWVNVKDLKKSKDFFTKTLGLKIFEDKENYGWLELNAPKDNTTFGLCKSSSESFAQNAVITFVVDNFDQTKKELTSKGIEFFNEISGYPGVPKMVSFKDPDGNIFQLVEEENVR